MGVVWWWVDRCRLLNEWREREMIVRVSAERVILNEVEKFVESGHVGVEKMKR